MKLFQRYVVAHSAAGYQRLPLDEKWVAAAQKAMKGKDPNTLIWHTPEDIPIKPLYTAKDREFEHGKPHEVVPCLFLFIG